MGVFGFSFPSIQASRPAKKVTGEASFSAQLDFQAAAAGEGDAEDEPKQPTFTLLANTGKPMNLSGFFDPVVINLKGAKFSRKVTPVIADHDTSRRIGYTTAQAVILADSQEIGGKKFKGPSIAAAGVVLSSGADAQEFVAQAKDGFPFQVSVGADIIKGRYVDEGKTAVVNGKTWNGPLIVAEKTVIRELTITALGADDQTVAAIAAERAKSMNEFQKWLQAMGMDEDSLTDEQRTQLKAAFQASKQAGGTSSSTVQATAGEGGNGNGTASTLKSQSQLEAENDRRISRIKSISASYGGDDAKKLKLDDGTETTLGELRAKAIGEEWDADRFELAVLRASRTVPTGTAIHMAPQIRDMEASTISCAIAKQFMPSTKKHTVTGEDYGYEAQYSQQALEASDHPMLRNPSLHQIMNIIVARANGLPYTGNMKSDDFIQATRGAMQKLQAASGFTTLEVTNIFDDVANKMLWAAYQSIATTWQEWCGVANVNDFKTHNMYRLTSKGGYQEVGVDGELKHGGFSDDKYTIAADTYGKIVGLNRKHIINDDLGALSSIMRMLGMDGARLLEELAYVYLLNQTTTLFPTAGTNKNYISGATSDLGIDGLTNASQKFDDQVDADNAPLMFPADRILVGTQDKVLAGQLFGQSEIRTATPTSGSTSKDFINNPHVGRFSPIVSGYLNNTSIKQRIANVGQAIPNQSSNQWFMFGPPNSPQGAIVMMAFLNGKRTPTIEQADASFNVLGLQWRAFHDAGVGSGDPKLGVMSKGAA